MAKNKTIGLVVSFVSVAILALVLVAMPSRAQEDSTSGNGLRITPIRSELTLAPGQSETYEIEVTNISNDPIDVVTIVNDFESDNETGQPRLLVQPDQKSAFSLRDYVTVPDQFRLEPGDSQDAQITVALPDGISPGGYFGVVRFAPGGVAAEEGAVALTASVGSLLLVSVPGAIQEGMQLGYIEARITQDDGTTKSMPIFETAPDIVAINLENTGNSILKPYGTVLIRNMFGSEVLSYEFNGGQIRGNILPQSARTFEDSISGLGPIGRYTVEANLSYSEGGGELITATTTFWVIPWRLLLVVLAVLILVVWFATRGIKIYNRKVVEKAKRNS